MPKTLTLKDIPDAVYERLKAAAQVNRRSLGSQAIVCLERVLLQTPLAPAEHLARVRAMRGALTPKRFLAREIDALKKAGRA